MIETQIEQIYKLFKSCNGVCTDTRSISEGGLFIALRGANFNGNKFAKEALEKGATYALVDEVDVANGKDIFYVKNGLKALQELATFHRDQFDIPILAITGSNGKTTTKELCATVLSQNYSCHFTKGNFNNHIGVPLTLLEMKSSAEVAIIEMGANHVGEIAELCAIAKPTHGLITNIGKAHLEGFGGIEGVKKGKSELYLHLSKHNGVAFINQDESFLNELSKSLGHRRVFYGSFDPQENEKWLRANATPGVSEFLDFQFWDHQESPYSGTSQLVGAYNIANLVTAICIGLYFKVKETGIVKAIDSYLPTNNRSQLVEWKGGKIILDAYNANPSSVQLALQNFEKMEGASKKIILGAMKELGEYASAEHLKIAEQAKATMATEIIFVGTEFKEAASKLNLKYFENVEDLKSNISAEFFKDQLILIKGSRSTTLEKILESKD